MFNELMMTGIFVTLLFSLVALIFYMLAFNIWNDRPPDHIKYRSFVLRAPYKWKAVQHVIRALMNSVVFLALIYIGAGLFSMIARLGLDFTTAANHNAVPITENMFTGDSNFNNHMLIGVFSGYVIIVGLSAVTIHNILQSFSKIAINAWFGYKHRNYKAPLQDQLIDAIESKKPHDVLNVYDKIKEQNTTVILTSEQESYLSKCLLIKSEVSEVNFDRLKNQEHVMLSNKNIISKECYLLMRYFPLYTVHDEKEWNQLETVQWGYDKPKKSKETIKRLKQKRKADKQKGIKA